MMILHPGAVFDENKACQWMFCENLVVPFVSEEVK